MNGNKLTNVLAQRLCEFEWWENKKSTSTHLLNLFVLCPLPNLEPSLGFIIQTIRILEYIVVNLTTPTRTIYGSWIVPYSIPQETPRSAFLYRQSENSQTESEVALNV